MCAQVSLMLACPTEQLLKHTLVKKSMLALIERYHNTHCITAYYILDCVTADRSDKLYPSSSLSTNTRAYKG